MACFVYLIAFCSGSFCENVKEKPYLVDNFWAESACDGSEDMEWENVVGEGTATVFYS